jgi:hypothetical protein
MQTLPTHTTAPAHAEGNHPSLAKAYLKHLAEPNSEVTLNAFGEELQHLLQRFLPDGSQQGCLRGQESDLRQSAALLLLQRYLAGNSSLSAAAETKDLTQISEQILRTTWAAIRKCLRHEIRRDQVVKRNLVKIVDPTVDHAIHSQDIQRRHEAVALIERSASKGKISIRDSEILKSLLLEEKTRNEVANEHGIGESAVSRLVSRATSVLREDEHTSFDRKTWALHSPSVDARRSRATADLRCSS